MTYFKCLIINFLTVFFVNHVIPGIDVACFTKLPNIEKDIVYAFSVGFVNSLIFPFFVLFNIKPTHLKIGISSFLISFISYGIVNLMNLGVKISHIEAFIWATLIVWFMAYITNYLEIKHYMAEKERKDKDDNNHLS